MQVLSSVEMLRVLGDNDDARIFCAEYPFWYNYRMCTLETVEIKKSIFGLLDTVWKRNNTKKRSCFCSSCRTELQFADNFGWIPALIAVFKSYHSCICILIKIDILEVVFDCLSTICLWCRDISASTPW